MLILALRLSQARKEAIKQQTAYEELKAKLSSVEKKLDTLLSQKPVAEKKSLTPEPKKPEPPATPAKKTEAKKTEAKEPVEPAPKPQPKKTLLAGLQKTRSAFFSRLGEVLGGAKEIDQSTYEQLEELLVTSDLGVKTAEALLTRVKEQAKENGESLTPELVRSTLKDEIAQILSDEASRELDASPVDGGPKVLLIVGVNGVGKTTTIGKLAKRASEGGAKVMVAACDTFRAAAVEQIKIWGERAGVEIISGDEGAKPSTVAYQAVHKAKEDKADLLIIDTAGRLHTRVNLMNELASVVSIITRELPGAPHESFLVLDATTGQNALQQAREFNETVTLSGIVITKLDGTPKGGIVVAIKDELGIPIRYIGIGEGAEDLRVF